MILLTHPTGNVTVRHAALGLDRAGLLGEFWTGANQGVPTWMRKILPSRVYTNLRQRAYPDELGTKIHVRSWPEVSRRIAQRVGLGGLTRRETGRMSEDSVYRALDQAVAKQIASGSFAGVYAYENGAEAAFTVSKQLKQLCIYDKPTGYWKAAHELFLEEAELEPQWAETLPGHLPCEAILARRDAELALADVIIVPSTFVKRTIERHTHLRSRVAVVPYGTPTHPSSLGDVKRTPSSVLRILYVGALSQRRGLSYLFAAARQLAGAVELTIAGPRPPQPCAILDNELSKVKYVNPDSPLETLRLMAQSDVLVVPSLFENFGLELLDAMALGLPVIATPHSAAPDLITDGVDGFIVPIRSAQAIAERLHLLLREPDLRAEVGRRALSRVHEFNWRRYEATLGTRVSETLAFAGRGTCSSFARADSEPELPGVLPRSSGK